MASLGPTRLLINRGSDDVLDEDVMHELSKVIEKQAEEKAEMIVEKEDEMDRERKEKQLKKLRKKDKEKLSAFAEECQGNIKDQPEALALVLKAMQGKPYLEKRGLKWYKAANLGLTDEQFSVLAENAAPGFIELGKNKDGQLVWIAVSPPGYKALLCVSLGLFFWQKESWLVRSDLPSRINNPLQFLVPPAHDPHGLD